MTAPSTNLPELAARFFQPRRAPLDETGAALLQRAERLEDDHGLEVFAWGQGETVLLVHGWESRAAHMAALIDALAGRGLRAVAFDGPAHGDSPGIHASAVLQAESALRLARRLGPLRGIIGHSMGGAAAAIALAHGAQAQRAVLLAAPASLRRVLERAAGGAGLHDHLEAFLHAAEELVGARLEDLEISRLAPRLAVPALLLHDPADREVPFAEGQEIAAHWPGARLEAVPEAGHRRILRRPDTVARAVNFVAGSA
ncbi:pimeloyl-ACP methyl ester carboxylesterase [Deinobacterium chartae]|uniref:Pimeloyl-ACP methyl ester carboxylesterase n=1 Tax=Deinobacterium chartae TaxID=521158 RepID=A0A841HYK9_9DEIO|nr:alpha/beta fold hydrolase [Deinobacterium chartae]MBB6096865.1 pimeloyl-ACP methyl ester carboxylesterase [Deinobacterium chartae]